MNRLLPLLVLAVTACGSGEITPLTSDGPALCAEPLVCPAAVTAECAGAETVVEVADATTCELPLVLGDDRVEAYALGTTDVTFTATLDDVAVSIDASCTTPVVIEDTRAPIVACEEELLVVRDEPGADLPEPPRGEVHDVCDSAPTVTVSPSVLTEKETDVVTTATDASGNEATCTTPVRVLDLFAPQTPRLLGADLDGADTVFTLGFRTADDDATEVVIERSESRDGPWTAVTTAAAADHLAEVRHSTAGWYRAVAAAEGQTGGASEPVRVRAVVGDGYNIGDVDVPTVPFPTSLYGVIRHPADLSDGPFPLVLLLHGNHGNCRRDGTRNDYCGTITTHECDFDGYSAAPNAEGMVYQAETLAAHGYIAATLSANALNCRRGYILERAQLLGEHLRTWKQWNEGEGLLGETYAGKVDLSRVGLVGHSRGGDAVSHVPQLLVDTPIEGVDVRSIFAIAPTDYNDATVFDADWALLLPACDGDVSSLWGSDIYERSVGQVGHQAQVLMTGANHNYYSTEWAYDDGQAACRGSDRVGLEPQLTMLQATLGSWMSHTLEGEAPEAFHRAEASIPEDVAAYIPRSEDLRWSYTTADATVVSLFEGDLDTNQLGGAITYTGFSSALGCFGGGCGTSYLSVAPGLRTSWSSGGRPGITLDLNGVGTADYDALSFRIVSLAEGANSGRSQQPYQVVVTDQDGATATVDQQDLVEVPHLYSAYDVREVLQTVRVPFALLEEANTALDTSRLASLRIDVGTDGQAGAATVTSVELLP